MTTHSYAAVVTWTGNRGTGTSGHRDYGRDHDVTAVGPAPIAGSADPAFRGDPARWNPEQLLVASLAQCHMLTYLHLCTIAGVAVTRYVDRARATMLAWSDGGRFEEVVLAPTVTVADPAMAQRAASLHDDAHRACFVANSVNFTVRHEPTVAVEL
ncbi:OsmC family protein [Micromonospora sp. LOL_024]|uniref:OsmC family protein n=1 Tax=Micromonospora sp. LOL_024 TaxID=3345412 RepID=UPI003A8B2FF9